MDNQQLIELKNLVEKWIYESAAVRNAILDTTDYEEQRRLRIEYKAIDSCVRDLSKLISEHF